MQWRVLCCILSVALLALALPVVSISAQEPTPTALPTPTVAPTPEPSMTTEPVTTTTVVSGTVVIGGYADGSQGVAKLHVLISLFGFSFLILLQVVGLFVLRRRR